MSSGTGHDATPCGDAGVPVGNGERAFPARVGPWRFVDGAALVALAVVAVAVRFWTRSPMWLDEALTVDIANGSLSGITGALRHDGHPPLYYVLLHAWMSVFGESDRAVRALPAVFGMLAVPAAFLVGRRVGGRTVAWCTAVVFAVSPFAVRYSTESRMYSLLMLLVLLGWLCADSALRRTRPWPLIGLAACTSALLWTQYWALWLGVAAALALAWRAFRAHRTGAVERMRRTLWTLGALAVGAASFLPWVPTMLYQQAHTGTPWASRAMPPTVLVTTVRSLGGETNASTEVGGWVFAMVIALGLFGVGVASGRIELDLRTRRWIRPLAWLAGGTWFIGLAVMVVTNSAFQPRYNAVWLPFVFVIAAVGVAVLRGPVLQRGALALIVLASATGIAKNVTSERTQAGVAAAAIERDGAPGDVVAVCPDQLGPALARRLSPGDFDVVSFPDFGDPTTVDWVDYVDRTNSVDATDFARGLVERAGPDRTVFVVWSETYTTHREVCRDIVIELGASRPDNVQLVEAERSYYESEHVTAFRPAPDP